MLKSFFVRAMILAEAAILTALLAVGPVRAEAGLPRLKLYSPKVCLACIDYAEHLRNAGFEVDFVAVDDMAAIKRRLKVPAGLLAEPTGVVAGYFIEGHVPADDIKELLRDRPKGHGLAVPGLPLGAPGRENTSPTCDTGCTVLDSADGEKRIRRELYDVLLVKPNGTTSVFSRH